MVALVMALAPRDIALALAVAALGWPAFNLLDRIAFGLAVAGAGQ